jgi:hypothetical protein
MGRSRRLDLFRLTGKGASPHYHVECADYSAQMDDSISVPERSSLLRFSAFGLALVAADRAAAQDSGKKTPIDSALIV